MTDPVPSAARVLDLLEHLGLRREGVSLAQAAAGLGLPKSSTLMLLRTLVARGYAVRDAQDRYRLDEAFRTLGFGWGGQGLARLLACAGPVMQALSEGLGETVILGALEGTQVRLLAKAVAAAPIRYDVDLATPSPAYCTAMGRVLLALAPEARREAILAASERRALTPATVTALPALRALLDGVAAARLAVVEEEFALGGTGIAAPVLGPEGEVLAALDVACVSARFPHKREAILPALRAAADRLGALAAAGHGTAAGHGAAGGHGGIDARRAG